MSNRILIGSHAFFKDMPEFTSKDKDEIEIVENGGGKFQYMMQISTHSSCLFKIVRRPKEKLFEYALTKSPGMGVGKFLVPEFNKEFGITVEDLNTLKPLVEKLDEPHMYEKIIFDAYIENNDFVLTDEQLNAAYESYKATRKDDKDEKRVAFLKMNKNERKQE